MIRKADTIRGCYYISQKCKFCGKLVWGESEESRKKARVDFWRRMKQHGKDFHPEIETEIKGAKNGTSKRRTEPAIYRGLEGEGSQH